MRCGGEKSDHEPVKTGLVLAWRGAIFKVRSQSTLAGIRTPIFVSFRNKHMNTSSLRKLIVAGVAVTALSVSACSKPAEKAADTAAVTATDAAATATDAAKTAADAAADASKAAAAATDAAPAASTEAAAGAVSSAADATSKAADATKAAADAMAPAKK